ncbi:MAG: twin-arginine translocation signal domain-containing protein, partial [Alphaproteobacteria bacterium]|nr:twin-arginine translocation signal domain-containing protein [Alphaproteobacteria bacterium]
MQILRRRGWELPESEATPEAVFHDRRRLIQAAALGGIAAAAGPIVAHATTTETDPTADLY